MSSAARTLDLCRCRCDKLKQPITAGTRYLPQIEKMAHRNAIFKGYIDLELFLQRAVSILDIEAAKDVNGSEIKTCMLRAPEQLSKCSRAAVYVPRAIHMFESRLLA